MERLTLQEFQALLDRRDLQMGFWDTLHARIRQAFQGGKEEDHRIFRPKRTLSLDHLPSFDDVLRAMDS